MSAYVVNDECIDIIVSGLKHLKGVYNSPIRLYDVALGGISDYSVVDEDLLGQHLLNINVAAVNGRYNESNEPDKYVHKVKIKNLKELYSSLKELEYQCSEQPVVDSDEFKSLSQIVNIVARVIADKEIY